MLRCVSLFVVAPALLGGFVQAGPLNGLDVRGAPAETTAAPNDGVVTSVVETTETDTITSCAASVTNCPGRTTSSEEVVTSVVETVETETITSCASTVTNCPASKTPKVVTSTVTVNTTVCPGTQPSHSVPKLSSVPTSVGVWSSHPASTNHASSAKASSAKAASTWGSSSSKKAETTHASSTKKAETTHASSTKKAETTKATSTKKAAASHTTSKKAAATTHSSINGKISRSEIISRGEYWISRHVPYSMEGSYPDPEGTKYRTDCSGFVSMAIHISPPGLSTVTLPEVATEIAWDSLQPGDFVGTLGAGTGGADGHVTLFHSWVDSSTKKEYNSLECRGVEYGCVAYQRPVGWTDGSFTSKPYKYTRVE